MRVATVSIRTYRGGDETGIVSCWNRSCPGDGIHLTTFVRRVLCDANFDPEGLFIAEAQGRIVGFLYAVARRVPLVATDLEPENGWITAFGVDPEYQRQGVGTSLMEAAFGFFSARGRRTVSFSDYAPNYFVPGIDRTTYPAAAAFLERVGFRSVYSCVSMDKSLILYQTPADVLAVKKEREAEGYRFESLSPARVAETIRFANEAFHADWGRAIREAVISGIPYDQFLIAIDPLERVVGFAMFGGYDGISERFGPFGVADSQRGKGIGKVLLYLTLDVMRSKGLHGCWFLWTGERSPAGHLYRRAGFTVTRTFDIMRLRLAE